MGWLDAWERRAREAVRSEPAPALMPAPIAPERPKPKRECVWVMTRSPRGPGDAGEALCGFYSVADGVVTMRDENGKALGKSQAALGPNDDARQIAGRLVRAAWLSQSGESNFNRP